MPSAYDSFRSSSPDDFTAPVGPKVAASVVLITAGLAAFVAPALTMRLEGSLNSLIGPPTPAPVRIVDAERRPGVPCAQQTWPYIDAHCLKQGGDKLASSDKVAKVDVPEYGPPVVDAPKAETKSDPKTEVAKLETMPQAQSVAASPDSATASLPARVPLPTPRPVAADDDDEYLPPPPVERRQFRQRRHYGHSDPRQRLVRQLNRVIPFGILRF